MSNSLTKKPEAILFDLDGTLADTILQLAKAAFASARELGVTPPDIETAKSYVGNGVNLLLTRILLGRFDVTADDISQDDLKKARAVFDRVYTEGLSRDFTLYQGVKEGIEYFHSQGIKLAVITNKPQIFAVPLIGHMGLAPYFDYILGGEVLDRRKPDAAPIHHVLDRLSVKAHNALMVGDSENDTLAAANAGVASVFLTYGYNRRKVEDLTFDYRFDTFGSFTDFIRDLP
ncbi:MAG: HAD-IA family hydrolase [Succinivibrio sp.]